MKYSSEFFHKFTNLQCFLQLSVQQEATGISHCPADKAMVYICQAAGICMAGVVTNVLEEVAGIMRE